jgi:hypothetical protein
MMSIYNQPICHTAVKMLPEFLFFHYFNTNKPANIKTFTRNRKYYKKEYLII